MGSTARPMADSSSTSDIASVIVINESILEKQVAGLINVIEIKEKQVVEDDGEETSAKHQAAEIEQTTRELQILTNGGIQVDQLKDLILETVKGKFKEGSKSSFIYTKPYTKRIDSLRMPIGYQPLKFQ
ncbi:hypothetical protein ACS0TY_011832 [Phlomoides rotata]